MTSRLILNQGDRSESRIYYCALYLAESLGLFAKYDVDIQFTTAESGGHTIQGGQVPAVITGEADLTIGGPMVMMKNYQQQGPQLMCFCAAVAANPWFLAAANSEPGFVPDALRGKRVIDVGNVGTATLSFNWLLNQHQLSDQVTLIPGSGDQQADFAAVASGDYDYALHSMHALAPAVASGKLHCVASLAPLCGDMPWSAYIARRDVLQQKRPAFIAFTRAIAEAQQWLLSHDAAALAQQVQPWYADYPAAALVAGLDAYLHSGVFASGPDIARQDFEHFATLLTETGWLSAQIPVPYAALVDMSLVGAIWQQEK
ncbi:ABC transporter substrate-binding protein [Winslowiella toletana]|uniref:ABC transporter substrate-binding protein n=1 Tax=Winslowiella toletana TaxID=92490 RepID=UPI00034DA2E2|nr:ABC transporter substrate-binding protein [Winslowiella toletana]